MGVNDEREKLLQAEQYLRAYSPDSQEFEAALEHVIWVARNTSLRDAAQAVIRRTVALRKDERRFREKMKGAAL